MAFLDVKLTWQLRFNSWVDCGTVSTRVGFYHSTYSKDAGKPLHQLSVFVFSCVYMNMASIPDCLSACDTMVLAILIPWQNWDPWTSWFALPPPGIGVTTSNAVRIWLLSNSCCEIGLWHSFCDIGSLVQHIVVCRIIFQLILPTWLFLCLHEQQPSSVCQHDHRVR